MHVHLAIASSHLAFSQARQVQLMMKPAALAGRIGRISHAGRRFTSTTRCATRNSVLQPRRYFATGGERGELSKWTMMRISYALFSAFWCDFFFAARTRLVLAICCRVSDFMHPRFCRSMTLRHMTSRNWGPSNIQSYLPSKAGCTWTSARLRAASHAVPCLK